MTTVPFRENVLSRRAYLTAPSRRSFARVL
jgi:hypothetical protein